MRSGNSRNKPHIQHTTNSLRDFIVFYRAVAVNRLEARRPKMGIKYYWKSSKSARRHVGYVNLRSPQFCDTPNNYLSRRPLTANLPTFSHLNKLNAKDSKNQISTNLRDVEVPKFSTNQLGVFWRTRFILITIRPESGIEVVSCRSPLGSPARCPSIKV
jgi:hypothetical protein